MALKKASDPCSLPFLIGMMGGAYKAFSLLSYSVTLLICAAEVPKKDYASSFPPMRYIAPESLVLETLLYPIQRGESCLLSVNKIK